jgi:hypothetical protein
MNRFLKSRKFAGVIGAIVVGIFIVNPARGERAYLPAVGAPPLRFQAFTTNHLVFDLKSFVATAKPAEILNAAAPVAMPANPTNLVAVSNQIPVSAAIINQENPIPAKPEIVADAKKSFTQRTDSEISSPAASDLLTVTPQMISEYLKPEQNEASRVEQPGPIMFVPPEMQFTPPAPKTSGESRAIYKSQ